MLLQKGDFGLHCITGDERQIQTSWILVGVFLFSVSRAVEKTCLKNIKAGKEQTMTQ